MPLDQSIKKVLVIGSGPIVIGQAAEFDYAGAQACRVLKQAGVNVVLVNSNPATIMTDQLMADEIYLEPLTARTVERIIEKERPDSLLAGLGGQTGLTIAMQLWNAGFLQSHGVRLIGSDVEAIEKAEDRQRFRQTMAELGQPTIPSDIATDVETALEIGEKIGYPIIIRPAFTLGGAGGGVAYSRSELRQAAQAGLDASPITQILVEQYIYGWKEIEFETMRDVLGNTIAVCSMENVDPVGIHTGDSVVVAPALTLSDRELQMLRTASVQIIDALGIVGGCNCQFALDPDSFRYAVIEVNPRVSRSSALASKATGYPIAKITAKLALGYTLDEIENDITGQTCACFEPALDYVVVKLPKWPFDKFAGSSRTLGTQMKATGEVMAMGGCFEMALMKAVRGAELSVDTLNAPPLDDAPLAQRLRRLDDRRLFTLFEALKAGYSVETLHELTKIDRFFLGKLAGMAALEKRLCTEPLTEELYRRAKAFGYPDSAIGRLSGQTPAFADPTIFHMVDTCGGEFRAQTPYFYADMGSVCEARSHSRSGKPVVLVLGSGPIRIGQGIEFDYSSVHCVHTLRELGYDAVIVNNNPETVSTDYDTADRLYFEPLTPEDVQRVIDVEKPVGVVAAFGGQTAIRLTGYLDKMGIPILGTSAAGIDLAEDREKFDALLEKLRIRRPRGHSVTDLPQALAAARDLGYPVLLRPSYVIGGQNMQIVSSDGEVRQFMERILAGGIDNAVLVDQYMPGSELEVDVISDGQNVLIPGVMQHIERAGVHSGDSIAVFPPYNVTDRMMKTIVDGSTQLALALGTKGLVNIQYLIYQGGLYVIEVNPRASRTVPYISKVTGVPMVDLACRVMLGAPLDKLGWGTGLYAAPPYCAVKVPVFSFDKLQDANSYLGPEMKSTGEVLGLGKNLAEALYKGLTAAGGELKHPQAGAAVGVLLSVDSHDLGEVVGVARRYYEAGLTLYATPDTARAIEDMGVDVTQIPGMTDQPHTFSLLDSGQISYIVYTGALRDQTVEQYTALHRKARSLGIVCMTSLDTANALADTIASRYTQDNTELVDLNHMRRERQRLQFAKLEGTGNDYIFMENFDGSVTAPESLCVRLCDRARGVGACGIVLLERSGCADAKMRIFNGDGSEGRMAGNAVRCAAKYLHDKGLAAGETMTIETASGVKTLELYLSGGKVSYATVDMGAVSLDPRDLPCTLAEDRLVDHPAGIGGRNWRITCCSVGNPHCVVFCEHVDAMDVAGLGPLFEHAAIFPARINTEFVRVVNPTTVRMRVWERGNGETTACGTGACAAVVAAVENGLCPRGADVTVQLTGGDVVVNYSGGRVTLSGDANLVYTGTVEL